MIQEVFENIIEKLKKKRIESYTKFDNVIEMNAYNDGIDDAIKIAEQVAEEYGEIGNCEHKWIFQSSQHKTTVSGYEHYTAHYHRVDVYFCEKCCEVKKIEQKEAVSLPFGGIHHLKSYAPVWYQPKGE